MSDKKFGRYISMLTKYTHSYFDHELKSTSLGRGDFAHIMRLYEKDSVTQDYLSKKICVDKGSTAKVIKRLLDLGYVTREINPEDKRSNLIRLTEKAWELKKEMMTLTSQWDEVVKIGISEEEFDLFIKIAMKMAENAKNYHEYAYKGEFNER